MKHSLPPKTFTVGKLAKLLGVVRQTVINWETQGKITSRTIPGSNGMDWRVYGEETIPELIELGYPESQVKSWFEDEVTKAQNRETIMYLRRLPGRMWGGPTFQEQEAAIRADVKFRRSPTVFRDELPSVGLCSPHSGFAQMMDAVRRGNVYRLHVADPSRLGWPSHRDVITWIERQGVQVVTHEANLNRETMLRGLVGDMGAGMCWPAEVYKGLLDKGAVTGTEVRDLLHTLYRGKAIIEKPTQYMGGLFGDQDWFEELALKLRGDGLTFSEDVATLSAQFQSDKAEYERRIADGELALAEQRRKEAELRQKLVDVEVKLQAFESGEEKKERAHRRRMAEINAESRATEAEAKKQAAEAATVRASKAAAPVSKAAAAPPKEDPAWRKEMDAKDAADDALFAPFEESKGFAESMAHNWKGEWWKQARLAKAKLLDTWVVVIENLYDLIPPEAGIWLGSYYQTITQRGPGWKPPIDTFFNVYMPHGLPCPYGVAYPEETYPGSWMAEPDYRAEPTYPDGRAINVAKLPEVSLDRFLKAEPDAHRRTMYRDLAEFVLAVGEERWPYLDVEDKLRDPEWRADIARRRAEYLQATAGSETDPQFEAWHQKEWSGKGDNEG